MFIGHNGWYQDDYNTRFTYLDDKTRKCNWCGQVQHKRIEEMVRKKEIWEEEYVLQIKTSFLQSSF